MDIPKLIRVERYWQTAEITVDGQPFPYAVAREDIILSVDPDGMPSVTLTIYADRVEVVNDINRPTTTEDRA